MYYIVWMYVLPHFGKYAVRQEIVVLDDQGTNSHILVKVPLGEVDAWDAAHDPTGRPIGDSENEVQQAVKGDYEAEKSV